MDSLNSAGSAQTGSRSSSAATSATATATVPYPALRSVPRIDLAAAAPLPAPLTVYVEPTNLCNLACDFCPQSLDDYAERAGYHQHMPLAVFARLMDEVQAMQVKSLKLYFFGEPLMHPQIGQMCKLAAGAAERVELTTNLIPLTDHKALEIVCSGIHYIRVSWYGDQPERVRRNLTRLQQTKQALGRDQPHVCLKLHDSAQQAGVESLGLSALVDSVTVEQLHTIASDFVHLRSYPESKQACPYPFYTLVVKANGDVVPCCVAWDKSLVVGNIAEQSLAEIWAGERLAKVQRLHLAGRRCELAACKSCDVLWNSPDSVDGLTVAEFDRRRGASTTAVAAGAAAGAEAAAVAAAAEHLRRMTLVAVSDYDCPGAHEPLGAHEPPDSA